MSIEKDLVPCWVIFKCRNGSVGPDRKLNRILWSIYLLLSSRPPPGRTPCRTWWWSPWWTASPQHTAEHSRPVSTIVAVQNRTLVFLSDFLQGCLLNLKTYRYFLLKLNFNDLKLLNLHIFIYYYNGDNLIYNFPNDLNCFTF